MTKYQVAISFAGENRDQARRLANALRRRSVSVFYDEFFLAEMVGHSLSEYLERVFSAESQHCVMLISEDYVRKPYPSHERRAALARALTDTGYLIPIRLDDAKIPGLSDDTCYLDLRRMSFTKVVRIILRKLDGSVKAYFRKVTFPLAEVQSDISPHFEAGISLDTGFHELIADLRQKLVKRASELKRKYPGINWGTIDDRALFSILSREMTRAIECILLGKDDDTVLHILPRHSLRGLSEDVLSQHVDSVIIEIMCDLDVLEKEEGRIVLGRHGREIAKSVQDSWDMRFMLLPWMLIP
jgi:hypothetical protein